MSKQELTLQIAAARRYATNIQQQLDTSPLRATDFVEYSRELLRALDTDTLAAIWDDWNPDHGWGARDPGMYIIEGIHWVLSERGEQHLVPI